MAIHLTELKEREAELVELEDRETELDDREAELDDRVKELSNKEEEHNSTERRLVAWQENLQEMASQNMRIVDPDMTVLRFK